MRTTETCCCGCGSWERWAEPTWTNTDRAEKALWEVSVCATCFPRHRRDTIPVFLDTAAAEKSQRRPKHDQYFPFSVPRTAQRPFQLSTRSCCDELPLFFGHLKPQQRVKAMSSGPDSSFCCLIRVRIYSLYSFNSLLRSVMQRHFSLPVVCSQLWLVQELYSCSAFWDLLHCLLSFFHGWFLIKTTPLEHGVWEIVFFLFFMTRRCQQNTQPHTATECRALWTHGRYRGAH